MDDDVDQEKLHADEPLTKDDCASLLTKWARQNQENNADSLVERFPRIKPGIKMLLHSIELGHAMLVYL